MVCDEQIEALITDEQVWHTERAKSSIAHQVMTEILRSKQQAEGKATLPHHYSNEALLYNAALTGQFRPLERDKLDKAGLTSLTRLCQPILESSAMTMLSLKSVTSAWS